MEKKMKSMFRTPSSLTAVFFAIFSVTGCADTQHLNEGPPTSAIPQKDHQIHHPQGGTTQRSSATEQGNVTGQNGVMGGTGTQAGMMSQGSSGQMGMMGQGGQMDMKAMCEMHERMKNAATPAERNAMMNERMKNMSPEMKQQHMETMQRQCK
jgi:hypothetical protein